MIIKNKKRQIQILKPFKKIISVLLLFAAAAAAKRLDPMEKSNRQVDPDPKQIKFKTYNLKSSSLTS
jgi:hypothetical protein